MFRQFALAALCGLWGQIAVAGNVDPATLPHKSPPAGFASVDPTALLQQVFAQNADLARFDLQAGGAFRFTFHRDGRITYRPLTAKTDLSVATSPQNQKRGLLCMAPVGNWSGMCMRVYRNDKGAYFCTGVFGNQAKWKKKCRLFLP